jgi:predicted Zn-dependent peptidase
MNYIRIAPVSTEHGNRSICQILTGGRAGRLYRRVVETERTATMIEASNDTRHDPGIFYVWAEVAAGADAKAVLDAAREAGRQVAAGKRVSKKISAAVSKNFTDIDSFVKGANAYFKSLLEEKSKK